MVLILNISLKIKTSDCDTSVCLEDCTDKCQIALKSLISGINLANIMKIWEVKHMAVNITSVNYVVLSKFTFNLLKNRWFKKDVDLQKINTLDNYSSNIMDESWHPWHLNFI